MIKKHWASSIVNLLLLPVGGLVGIVGLGTLFAAQFGPSEDHFADNLVIPGNVNAAEPEKEPREQPGGRQDKFQAAVAAVLMKPGGDDPTVTANVGSLMELQTKHPDILRRYLASSPAWRVSEERGKVFATRRWMIGSRWWYTMNGYYTNSDIGVWGEKGPNFQSRLTIGLSGEPWARGNKDATSLKAGEKAAVKLSHDTAMYDSRLIISENSLAVEVFEQSDARERRITQTALDFVDGELAPLVEKPTWETIRQRVPEGSIQKGKPSLGLVHSFQPGLYSSVIWLNTGEPGMVYLKAFEVTKGTPLSAAELKEYSNEWVGWSDDPEELFLSNTHFTIDEGDWGKPYAARFEVWFVPDSGKPEHKLIEKVFKIEGWQR